MKKKKAFTAEPPQVRDLNEAQALIQELWGKLREYEDRLAASSRNSSQPPSQDSAADRAERKKLKRLVAEIRQALGLDTPDIDDA
ncbi:hypothetical protein KAM469_23770 [Aeromonas caviae]|jgi:hypothetical protein|nr:hypothetical protein KAM468_24430 [Aeromonas caviae]GKR27918.1 hypothetical protein KAM469_23770 [Aeromonas caviae]GKR32327.1 hypothetical protein KAM470_24000 [Aeromonas caviae]GKR61749.1 hypothetical protein KAM477_23710 [Aeromonas caviae]GKR66221.1 hypothetical protein KAM478_24780 [Aeromonas caviae]